MSALLLLPSSRANELTYSLTLRLSSSRSFALLTALLFLLPPSPPTLHSVPYTEPFAALFSIAGMLLHVQQRDLLAALCWAVGSGFRAQGIVLGVGFFGWRYLLERPWASGKLQLSVSRPCGERRALADFTSSYRRC